MTPTGASRPHAAGGVETESLFNALRVLRERWWLVLATFLLCAAITVGLSLTRPDVYRASAGVLFGQSQLADAAFGIQRDTAQPERFASTQVLVATSPEVTDRAKKTLKTSETRDALVSQVSVETSENADVLTFNAEASTAREAAAIANAYARGYVDFSRDSEVRQLEANIRSLQSQIDSATLGSTERRDIEQRRSNLQSLLAAANGGAQVIGSAEAPDDRSSPNFKRDALLGALLGLVVGVALAFLVDLFDRRVKTVEGFERLYDMRALASIPQASFTARNQRDRAKGFEPYRVLRNAIGFEELTRELNAILVTSAMPSEGKSSVAINLARTFALAGQQVVLVECDLRRPALAQSLEIAEPGGGLTTALVGRRAVHELLRPVGQGMANFSVLPSGPLPPNAAELLRSPQMGDLIAELKMDGARVILDAPPLLPIADAQGLLDHPQIDGALFVARAYQTTQDEARRARAMLDQHRLQPLGIVVTGLKDEDSYGYYGVDPGGVPARGVTPTQSVEREGAARR